MLKATSAASNLASRLRHLADLHGPGTVALNASTIKGVRKYASSLLVQPPGAAFDVTATLAKITQITTTLDNMAIVIAST